jgi:uncharacterized protein
MLGLKAVPGQIGALCDEFTTYEEVINLAMAQERIPLEELTLRQLRRVASEYKVSRYSRMRKVELIAAIRAIDPNATAPLTSGSVNMADRTTVEASMASSPTSSTVITEVIAPVNPPEVEVSPVQEPINTPDSIPVMAQQESSPVTPPTTAAQSTAGFTNTAEEQETVEATKFVTGITETTPPTPEEMAAIDANLPDLPNGYGASRISLLPRDPQWAYCYWDVPNEHKDELRRQGGQQLALRIYDVTDIDLNVQAPHSIQEYACDELAREWYLPIPVSDRDYAIDVGYRTADGRWLMLARSASVHVPPVFPSDWVEDVFVTIPWDEDLRGQTFATLVPPAKKVIKGAPSPQYDEVFNLSEAAEAQRIAGSLFGSMHQVSEESLSSFIFPSGVGSWATVPTASGIGAVTASGIGMGLMETPEFITPSGAGLGFSASVPNREQTPRKFWLVADAELIVYGATEPDATVTIGGRPIKLNPDGTFRFQMSFQDGVIDYPIMAVAVDGVQTRSVHMNFERETPSRNTNTKVEAVEEWIS